jgi:integrase
LLISFVSLCFLCLFCSYLVSRFNQETNRETMKVTLREKQNKSGSTSLYLDIYHDGKREYEYLNLFLESGNTPSVKRQNKKTIETAEAVRSERLVQLQKGIYGFKTEKKAGKNDFLAFYQGMLNERDGTNRDNWFGAFKYLKAYTNGKLMFKDINVDFLEGFKKYLQTTKTMGTNGGKHLAVNSTLSYFNKIRAAINRAYELDYLDVNPVKKVKAIKQADANREYLTREELSRADKTECRYPVLKSAFMFSALTGLRWSDINLLTWGQIQYSKDIGWSVKFRQKKTDGQEYLPFNEQALKYLGNKGDSGDKIFVGLKYSAYMNVELSKWIMKAGITKDITFHCARHTHATLLISNGVDIYTVSKLLGHKDLKTTEIYAKVIDKKKIDAVKSLPLI